MESIEASLPAKEADCKNKAHLSIPFTAAPQFDIFSAKDR
jgi:hypothetical protein